MDASPNDLRTALQAITGYTDPHHDWAVRIVFKQIAFRYSPSPKRLVVRMGMDKLDADYLCHDLNLSLSQAASASVVPDYTLRR